MAIIENACGANDELMKQHIAMLADLNSKTASNVHRIDKHDEQIETIQKTHAILLSFETKLENVNNKVDLQISQSQENTKAIIKALIDNKPTLQDRILEAVIPLMVNGSLLGGIYLLMK